jgi:hypothetical protein
MRKTASALIMILLITSATQTYFVRLGMANPYIEGYFPLQPATAKPSIVVDSPIQNRDYSSGDAWLNFTIAKPETWFVQDVASTENYEPLTLAIGGITRVYYVIDSGKPQNITVEDGGLPSEFSIDVVPTRVFNFSVPLSLTGGLHSVKVGFEAETYYYTGWDVSAPGLRSVKVDGFSGEVNFRIAEPLQAGMITAVTIAVAIGAAVGLLLYRWKYRREAAPA